MKVVVASSNQGKIREMEHLLGQLGLQVESMAAAGLAPAEDFLEEGLTFEDNALSKAQDLMALAKRGQREVLTLGDDSGLVVDALKGAPGVFSARWAGFEGKGHKRDQANNHKLLEELSQVTDDERRASFVCSIALLAPDGNLIRARGSCPGRILFEPRGDNGFGYDPLFLPDGFSRTMAQLSMDEKNRISHRGRALRDLLAKLSESGAVSL